MVTISHVRWNQRFGRSISGVGGATSVDHNHSRFMLQAANLPSPPNLQNRTIVQLSGLHCFDVQEAITKFGPVFQSLGSHTELGLVLHTPHFGIRFIHLH